MAIKTIKFWGDGNTRYDLPGQSITVVEVLENGLPFVAYQTSVDGADIVFDAETALTSYFTVTYDVAERVVGEPVDATQLSAMETGVVAAVTNSEVNVSAQVVQSAADSQANIIAAVMLGAPQSGQLSAFRANSVPAGWTPVSGPAIGESGYVPNTILPVLPGGFDTSVRFATSGGVLYTLNTSGSTYAFKKFDEATGAWTDLATIGLAGNGSVAAGPLLVLPSGKLIHASVSATNGTALARIYDPVANLWSPAASLPVAGRSGGGFVMSDGTAYVCSASGARGYAYTEATNTWAAKAAAPTGATLGRGSVFVNLGNGKVLGIDASNTAYYLYDEALDTWSAAIPSGVGFTGGTALFKVGGFVYNVPFGSVTANHTLKVYTIDTGTWGTSTEACLPANYGDAGALSDGSQVWPFAATTLRVVMRKTAAVPSAIVWAVKN